MNQKLYNWRNWVITSLKTLLCQMLKSNIQMLPKYSWSFRKLLPNFLSKNLVILLFLFYKKLTDQKIPTHGNIKDRAYFPTFEKR